MLHKSCVTSDRRRRHDADKKVCSTRKLFDGLFRLAIPPSLSGYPLTAACSWYWWDVVKLLWLDQDGHGHELDTNRGWRSVTQQECADDDARRQRTHQILSILWWTRAGRRELGEWQFQETRKFNSFALWPKKQTQTEHQTGAITAWRAP